MTVMGTTNVLHMPQSTSHVVGQTDQCTSQVVQFSGSHVNISEIICGMKWSLCSSMMAGTRQLSALAAGIKTACSPVGASGILT